MKNAKTTYRIFDDSISDELKKQLESIGEKPHHNKYQFSQEYLDGSYCDQVKRHRRTTLLYYCDQYGKAEDFYIVDVAEPDWCDYQIRIATKYMCTKLSSLPKASTRTLTSQTGGINNRDEMLKLSDNSIEHV